MALVFEVKVIPSAGTFGFMRGKNGELICRLKSAPEKGHANQELIKGLAKLLRITQSDIEIVSGLTSRKKKIKIHIPCTVEQLCVALDVPYQGGFVESGSDESCSIE